MSTMQRRGQDQPEQRPARQVRPLITSPFMMMRRMFDDMARLFESAELGPTMGGETDDSRMLGLGFIPRVDVSQRDGQLVVSVDLPGVEQDDVRVSVEHDALVIEGERSDKREYRDGNMWRSERTYGRFRRAVPLPQGADADSAEARFANGVLEISMKAPQEQQQGGRQIPIQGAGGGGRGGRAMQEGNNPQAGLGQAGASGSPAGAAPTEPAQHQARQGGQVPQPPTPPDHQLRK